MKTQGEDGHLQAKERDVTKSQPCSQIASPQTSEGIHFHFSDPVAGTWLWWP